MSDNMVKDEARSGSWGWGVALPLLLGFGLRLWYALQAEPFVDEPTTLLVAQAIARSGQPMLPSGLFYGNDLPFSYLAGLVATLTGPGQGLVAPYLLIVLRLLSVVAATLTLALVYLAGRRLFSPWAGWWAALFLALDPEAILWGGRARAYALLSLLVLLAARLFYDGLAGAQGNARRRRLGWLLLVIAVFVHPEAGLLLPAFVAGALLLRGLSWWLHPGRLAELALAGVAVAGRYWLQTALARGLVGGFETVAGSRPPVELAADWLARLEGVVPFFLAPHRLPWTLLALLALALAAWLARRQGAGDRDRAILFFSACLWLPPLGMFLFLGSTYQSPRYLTMLLPIFALLAGAGLARLVEYLAGRQPARRGTLAAGLAAFLLLAGYLPGALSAAGYQEKGFRPALETVAGRWQPGDRVASVAPAACATVTAHCDYFALGIDWEEFAFRDETGQLADRWLGLPLIRSQEDLARALAETAEAGGRLWFVTDEGRFRRRFEPAFAQAVWLQMGLVENVDGALVFVSRPAPEPAASSPVQTLFGDQVALVAYDLGLAAGQPQQAGWGEVVAHPGESLPLTLYWQAAGPVAAEYHVFVHLLGADGQRYAQGDGPPLDGLQPMSHWLPGETLPDRRVLDLPGDLPPGRYRLAVGLYRLEDDDRLSIAGAGSELILDYVRVPAPDESLPVPGRPVGVLLSGDGDQVRLLGYDLDATRTTPDGTLNLTLYWQAPARPAADYTVFVHLLQGGFLDAGDEIRGQGDGPPAGGFYPTSYWDPGEVVVDGHQVRVDADAPPGRHRLVVGLYLPADGRRLAADEGDRVTLAEIEVGP